MPLIRTHGLILTSVVVVFAGLSGAANADEKAKGNVDFRRDVEPLFQKHCMRCHGPEKRKGGLLLATRKEALLPTDTGEAAIVPGQSKKSELIRRLVSMDPDLRMPPAGDRLGAEQVKLISDWIDQGASWPEQTVTSHWAYVKPVRPSLPEVENSGWAKNPIDHFILARLDKEGVTPSPATDRERLIRRVYLDLIGLPPSIAQVDAFVADNRPDAYERVVDELLASPKYGERWARHWLDLARYADSNGFQRDGFRTVWPYRDWVVNAFNSGMPFDQFTIEQLAGDLLPEATVTQKIATGFNRCTTVNVEAGTDPEEGRVNAVFDRVNTTATVWLGTTITCAQCHNHKYDPFTQVDYYGLFAYFNNTKSEILEKNKTTREFIGPMMTMPLDPKVDARRKELQARREALAPVLKKHLAKQTDWEKECRANKAQLQKLPANIRKIIAVAEAKRTVKQKDDISNHFAEQQPEFKKILIAEAEIDQELKALESATTLVMAEMSGARPAFVLKRGNFLDRGLPVKAGVPAGLNPPGKDAPANRLGLARWIVSGDNPLVARVTVNRWWAEIFGRGLVATLEDFGSQGDRPTHPELLDWLAVEFMEGSKSAWSMKHIHRLIVTSATYQQSSRVTPDLLKRDPENKLYARGARFRLDAEMIRDNALAASGLLSGKMGGPPVFPPQPANLWSVTGNVDNTYRTSQGEDRYRRGLYTIWRRSSPYASFVAFDAPDRAACVVKRPRTNTPLQALTLLNDPAYVEAAVALGRRMAADDPARSISARIQYGFRLCLVRQPTAREAELLQKVYEQSLARYQADPKSARAVLQGALPDNNLDPVQWAAWFQVASVLLNLDETITKG
jgi:mono/diheme cytochrome c family protein